MTGRIICVVAALVTLGLSWPVAQGAEVHEDPLRRREIAIARELRCTVCQGESVAESNAGIARDMRKLIREKLAAGESKDQIVQYFVSRYGDFILLKPRMDLLGALLWVAPGVLLLVLGTVAYRFIRRKPHAPGATYAPLSAEDAKRVAAARRHT